MTPNTHEARLAELEKLAKETGPCPVEMWGKCEWDFVRAANPDTILDLITEIRRLREYEWMYKDLCK